MPLPRSVLRLPGYLSCFKLGFRLKVLIPGMIHKLEKRTQAIFSNTDLIDQKKQTEDDFDFEMCLP